MTVSIAIVLGLSIGYYLGWTAAQKNAKHNLSTLKKLQKPQASA